MKELAKMYLEQHAMLYKKSWRKDLSYINRLIIPYFHDKDIRYIKRIQVITWFNSISKSSGPVAANRAHEILRKMFYAAIDWEILKTNNPATRIKRNKEQSRTEFLSYEALPKLFEVLAHSASRSVRAMILIQLYSGLRPSEVSHLKWEHIDLNARLLTVPITKNGKPHSLPLTDSLLSILQALNPQQEGWVFPSRVTNQPLRNIHRAWYKVRDKAGLPNLRLHDLRRTVGSYLAMGNFSSRKIQEILNHDSIVSSQTYSRLDMTSKSEALNYQAEKINQLLTSANLPEPHLLLQASQLGQTLQPLQSAG